LIIIIILNCLSDDINKQVDRNKQQRYQFYPGNKNYIVERMFMNRLFFIFLLSLKTLKIVYPKNLNVQI
jgi:hypothetical protein